MKKQIAETCGSSPDQRQARGAGTSIKPGVERSETPGLQTESNQARGARDSPNVVIRATKTAVARLRGLFASYSDDPGVPASLHPRAGSPAEQLGWGARLYAVAALRGLNSSSEYLFRASPKIFRSFPFENAADLTSSVDSAWHARIARAAVYPNEGLIGNADHVI